MKARLLKAATYIVFYVVLFAILTLTENAFTHRTSARAAVGMGLFLGLIVSLGLLLIAEPLRKRITDMQKKEEAAYEAAKRRRQENKEL